MITSNSFLHTLLYQILKTYDLKLKFLKVFVVIFFLFDKIENRKINQVTCCQRNVHLFQEGTRWCKEIKCFKSFVLFRNRKNLLAREPGGVGLLKKFVILF